ncbi:MAG: peptidoglycan-associated lipoprotein Pal [Nitrospirae bacterium]|nr:peptidoglycan-associated lipoprotein Pal [Nitrospirota bacterium]
MKKILILVLIAFVAIGCAKKYVKPPEEPAKAEDVKPKEVQREKETPKKVEVVTEKVLTEAVKEAKVGPSIVEEHPFEFKDVLFSFDKYDIRPDAKAVLDSIASRLNKNKNINVLIEGHCDERGTNEYNLALGEKRARAVKDYLVSQGITPARIDTISYGEEKPLCTEQNEDCYQKNRRAYFIVTK